MQKLKLFLFKPTTPDESPPNLMDKTLQDGKFVGDENEFIEHFKKFKTNTFKNVRNAYSFLCIPENSIETLKKKQLDEYTACLIEKFYPGGMKLDPYICMDIVQKILIARNAIKNAIKEEKEKETEINNDWKCTENADWKFHLMALDIKNMMQNDRYKKYLENNRVLNNDDLKIKKNGFNQKKYYNFIQNENENENENSVLKHIVRYVWCDVINCSSNETYFKNICNVIKKNKTLKKNLYTILFKDQNNNLDKNKTLLKIVIPESEKNLKYLESSNILWYFSSMENTQITTNPNFKFTTVNDLNIAKNTVHINSLEKKIKKNLVSIQNKIEDDLRQLMEKNEKNIDNLVVEKYSKQIENQINNKTIELKKYFLYYIEENIKSLIDQFKSKFLSQIEHNRNEITALQYEIRQRSRASQKRIKELTCSNLRLKEKLKKINQCTKMQQKKSAKEYNKNLLRYFVLGTIVAGVTGCVIADEANNSIIGITVGLFLFGILVFICAYSWRKNAASKSLQYNNDFPQSHSSISLSSVNECVNR